MIKVAMMGAGSAGFSRMLIEDILSFKSMSDAHFALMDVDDERLKTVHRAMKRMKEQNDLSCTFSATLDRREALTDADFAISMIQVGGLVPYKLDVEIPMKYGVDQCVGDTVNPGGIFRGLRHIPALLDMMADMEEVSKPDIIFMNYANPMATVSWAQQKAYPHIESVGLCHGVQHTTKMLCKWIDVPMEECDVLTSGINHMAWFMEFRHNGVDLYPRMWEKLEKDGPIKGEEYRFEMMKATGYFMTESPGHLSEYLPYFRKRRDIMDLFNGPAFSGESLYYYNSCVRGHARYSEQLAKWADGTEPVMFRKGYASVEYAANIMNSKITGELTCFAGNVLNKGFIPNLPYDSCVEVPVFVDRLGMHGSYVGELPPQCASLCKSNIAVQEMIVKASLEGDLEAVYHACLLDPLTAAVLAPHEIRNMVDEMIEAQRQWLPQFEGKKATAPGHRVGRLANGATRMEVGAEISTQKGHYD
jgi:alpha-galactosidase